MNTEELDEELIKMDGYDDCIIGVGTRCGFDDILVYDTQKIINKLMQDNLTYEEADEYMHFNMIGAYVGERTPIFVYT
jgi:hypothetical protein